MRFDKDEIKRRVIDGGRVSDVLRDLCGVPSEAIEAATNGSTRGFPCPVCGGTDRFRITDVDAGRVFCNQCCNSAEDGCSDFFGAVQWRRQCDFPQALAAVAEYIGAQPVAPTRKTKTGEIEYGYSDAEGFTRWRVVRTNYSDGTKDCFPSRLIDGVWKFGLDIDPVIKRKVIPFPYRYGATQRANVIFIVEGEKCATKLSDLFAFAGFDDKFAATCVSGGTSAVPVWEFFSHFFDGKKIVVLGDDDAPGRKALAKTVETFRAKGFDVRAKTFEATEQFTALGKKGYDVADWLDDRRAEGLDSVALVQRLLRELDDPDEPTETPDSDDDDPFGDNYIDMMRLDEIPDVEEEWLWPNRFLGNAINLVAGNPGSGKSMFTCWLATILSTGIPFPDFPTVEREPVGTLFLQGEDQAPTIRKRCARFGADLSKIQVLRGFFKVGSEFPEVVTIDRLDDFQKVVEKFERTSGVPLKVLIIDPVNAFLPRGYDESKNCDVRALLTPLTMWCERNNVTLIIVTHFRKQSGDFTASTTDQVLGGRSLGGAARTIWALKSKATGRGKDREKWTKLLLAKSNCIDESEARGLRFKFENFTYFFDETYDALDADGDAEDTPPTKTKVKRNAAKEFILSYFVNFGDEDENGNRWVYSGQWQEAEPDESGAYKGLYETAANTLEGMKKGTIETAMKDLGAMRSKVGGRARITLRRECFELDDGR